MEDYLLSEIVVMGIDLAVVKWNSIFQEPGLNNMYDTSVRYSQITIAKALEVEWPQIQ